MAWLQARAGQIVITEITDPPTQHRGPIGRILAVLGERLTPSIIVEMAIASHNLPHEWPDNVSRQAADVDPLVSAAEIAGRVDLRARPLVTIDGEDARDFADAVAGFVKIKPRPLQRGRGWETVVDCGAAASDFTSASRLS